MPSDRHAPGPSIPWGQATDECVEILSRLLKFDTTNPPGNETPCARWIQDRLTSQGIDCTFVEPAPGRGSVVARIPARVRPAGGTGPGPLLLMSHTDVVPAVAEEWSHHPFSGDVAGGQVWGRGALDMKNTVATWLCIMLWLRRTGLETRRDVIFMASADEEAGGEWGAQWLAEHRWDLVGCEAALNEGGGVGVKIGKHTYYTVQTSEKVGCPFVVRARGTPGHASVPHADNAVVHLARAVVALGEARLPVKVTPSMRAFIEGVAADQAPGVRQALLELLEAERADQILEGLPLEEHQRATLSAQLRNAPCPTMLQAGSRVNVIPSRAEATMDCRVLPGETPDAVRRQLESVLEAAGLLDRVAIEFIKTGAAYESPPDGPLVQSIRRAMAVHAPDARVLPYLLTGATDGRFFRPRGVPVYGFSPTLPDVDIRTVHGIDERISVASLGFGLRVAWDVVVDFCSRA